MTQIHKSHTGPGVLTATLESSNGQLTNADGASIRLRRRLDGAEYTIVATWSSPTATVAIAAIAAVADVGTYLTYVDVTYSTGGTIPFACGLLEVAEDTDAEA